MNDRHSFNANVIEQFRSNGGKVPGPWGDGNLLLLHTTGAKSGRPRLNPAGYFRVGDKLLIAGTFAGADVDPAKVHNLRAQPAGTHRNRQRHIRCRGPRAAGRRTRCRLGGNRQSRTAIRPVRNQNQPHHPGVRTDQNLDSTAKPDT